MLTLSALVLATPIFHFSLSPPVMPAPTIATELALQLAPGAPDPTHISDEEVARQLAQRRDIALVHRAFGVSTWLAMATTAVLGFIQFGDEYGFHTRQSQTACAQQTAVLQEFCEGTPWPHAIAGITTAVLYFTTFGLSFAMPDPLDIEHQDSAWAGRVRAHRMLRWVHLAGLIAQGLVGMVISNPSTFGLDRKDDFSTLQGLAALHMGMGIATFGALTTAAALMTF